MRTARRVVIVAGGQRPGSGSVRVPRVVLALALASWLAPGGRALAVESTAVTFTARDGGHVAGSLFLPDKKPVPVVILLPMVGRTRADWDAAATRLAEAGIAALAIDFRRGGGPKPAANPDSPGDYSDLVLDVEAAFTFLSARADVTPNRIGIAGASIGANVAVIAAAGVPAVRSLALLSPTLEYRGLRIEQPLRKYGNRPALLIASEEDPYAMRSSRTMVTYGDGLRDLRIVSGAGHGTVMLSRQPDLVGALVDWFVRTLV